MSATTDLRRQLGWGVRLDPIAPGLDVGADLALTPDGNDLAITYGVDLLVQDLRLALTTLLGSSIFDTGYGFDGVNVLAVETDRRLSRERLRVAVIRVLQREPRIKRITAVSIEESSEPGDRTLVISASFEVHGGAALRFDIGKVPLT